MGSAQAIRCSIWALPFGKIRFSQLNTASAGIVPHCRFFSAWTEEMPEVIALNYILIYAYGIDTPSSSATSLTLIKISPAIGKIPSFPVLWLISSAVLSAGLWQATLFGAVPFSFLFGTLVSSPASPEKVSFGRSFHSVWLFWISPPLTIQRTFFLHLLTILIVKLL